MAIILFIFSLSPFNEANFVALPYRSISVLSNPAGIGITPGAELFLTYASKSINGGLTLGNFGFGLSHIDSITVYEIGTGVKLPGAFAIGYARQFGDTSVNFIGLVCILNKNLRLGYKTNLEKNMIMHGGASIKILDEILTLAGELIYDKADDSKGYLFGFIISPATGVKLNFVSDTEWNWSGGLALGSQQLKLSALYSHKTEKFCFGMILSAQGY